VKIITPTKGGPAFFCPHCRVHAKQVWYGVWKRASGGHVSESNENFSIAQCSHCNAYCLWVDHTLVHPPTSPAVDPHDDMPADVRADFEEARQIVTKSPRGAAALLRLVLQKLMPILGESGGNINNDIKNLVAKGLPVTIQQALDAVRVIGNESVHPGQLNLNDTPQVAHALFGLVNLIVDNQIAQPKRIAELYQGLPADKRSAIATRDATKSP